MRNRFRTGRSYSRLRGLVQLLSTLKPLRRKLDKPMLQQFAHVCNLYGGFRIAAMMKPQRLGELRYLASDRAVPSDQTYQ